MSTYITALSPSGSGPRVAVKDVIDVAGVPTTAGCRAVELTASPAPADAACLRGFREAGARLVGKTNMDELAMIPVGMNPWFGTPVNPVDPSRIPGGSSSGSAVAVASGEADLALGSDTGGSIRIPAACCGATGLKTTYGRIPLSGVWPLAPLLDTVGPIARDVSGVTLGMQLLEPGFRAESDPALRVGRIRTSADPLIESAIDEALRRAELEVVSVDLDLAAGIDYSNTLFYAGCRDVERLLPAHLSSGVGEQIWRILRAAHRHPETPTGIRYGLDAWRTALFTLFDDVQLLALPTLPCFPPRLQDAERHHGAVVRDVLRYTAPFNVAGCPALALPVPASGVALPASLQLVGPLGSESLLLATGGQVEDAVS